MPHADVFKRREYQRAYQEKWRAANPEKVARYIKNWTKSYPEKALAKKKRYIEKHRDLIQKYRRERYKAKPHHRIASAHRRELNRALLQDGSEERLWIESQFEESMNWENRGKGVDHWQIDHIMPLSAFDLESEQHRMLAFHKYNLRPLWSRDNFRKGCRIEL